MVRVPTGGRRRAARLARHSPLWCTLLALVPVPSTPAEVAQTVTVEAYHSGAFAADEAIASGLATGELDLRSTGAQGVRARLQLRATLTETDGVQESTVDVPRAEIRAQLPLAGYTPRITVGRSRLTWGEGRLYNAGDVINGIEPQTLEFTSETLRDETQWLAAAYLPIGRFSFAEPVVLVPAADPGESGSGPDATATAAGARVQGQIASVKSEAGYLFRGRGRRHQPYVSLQGNLGVDLYGAASLDIGERQPDRMSASAGAFWSTSTPRAHSWSLRVESVGRVERFDRDTLTIRVFPEVQWAPSRLFSVLARSEVLVVERAGALDADNTDTTTTVGVSWTPLTGLRIALFGGAVTGGARGTPPDGIYTATVLTSYTF